MLFCRTVKSLISILLLLLPSPTTVNGWVPLKLFVAINLSSFSLIDLGVFKGELKPEDLVQDGYLEIFVSGKYTFDSQGGTYLSISIRQLFNGYLRYCLLAK